MIFEENPDPLSDTSPCPVSGKYYNVPMGKVPAHFLDWFIGQPHLMWKYPLVMDYVARNKTAINQDLDRESCDDNSYNKWDDIN